MIDDLMFYISDAATENRTANLLKYKYFSAPGGQRLDTSEKSSYDCKFWVQRTFSRREQKE